MIPQFGNQAHIDLLAKGAKEAEQDELLRKLLSGEVVWGKAVSDHHDCDCDQCDIPKVSCPRCWRDAVITDGKRHFCTNCETELI